MKLVVSLLLLAAPLFASATIVALGDSFSDGGNRGNIPGAFGGILPATTLVLERLDSGQASSGPYPPAPYYYGRFTNGPVWIETAAGLLGQQVDNFAAGGSNGDTGRIIVKPPFGFVQGPTEVPVRSLVQQAQAYAALKGNAARGFEDSAVIFAGPDEYFQKLSLGTAPPDPSETISSVRQALNITYNAGVRKFVLVDLPSLSSFPFAAKLAKNGVDTLVSDHNSQLNELASSFNASNSGAQVYVYELSGLLEDVLGNPTNEAWEGDFTQTTGAALGTGDLDTIQAAGTANTLAARPEEYVFWDPVHFSSHFHYVFGIDFTNQFRSLLQASTITKAQAISGASPSS